MRDDSFWNRVCDEALGLAWQTKVRSIAMSSEAAIEGRYLQPQCRRRAAEVSETPRVLRSPRPPPETRQARFR